MFYLHLSKQRHTPQSQQPFPLLLFQPKIIAVLGPLIAGNCVPSVISMSGAHTLIPIGLPSSTTPTVTTVTTPGLTASASHLLCPVPPRFTFLLNRPQTLIPHGNPHTPLPSQPGGAQHDTQLKGRRKACKVLTDLIEFIKTWVFLGIHLDLPTLDNYSTLTHQFLQTSQLLHSLALGLNLASLCH